MSYDDHEPGLDPEPLSSGEQRELDNLRDELHKQHTRFRRELDVLQDAAAERWSEISPGGTTDHE